VAWVKTTPGFEDRFISCKGSHLTAQAEGTQVKGEGRNSDLGLRTVEGRVWPWSPVNARRLSWQLPSRCSDVHEVLRTLYVSGPLLVAFRSWARVRIRMRQHARPVRLSER
jgi:hypothetical protein